MDKLITDDMLRQGAEEGMDAFLKVFTDAYLTRIDGELTAETMGRLTGSPHALLGYHFFHTEDRARITSAMGIVPSPMSW